MTQLLSREYCTKKMVKNFEVFIADNSPNQSHSVSDREFYTGQYAIYEEGSNTVQKYIQTYLKFQPLHAAFPAVSLK